MGGLGERRLMVSALAIGLALLALPAAASEQWVEGVHYELIEPAEERPADAGIEVVEVFWYGCGSCFELEPHLERWLAAKPDDVEFVRVPASMSPGWRMHARAYHTAEVLGVVDPVHGEIFRAIHLRRTDLGDAGAFARLFQEHASIDEDAFHRAFTGFTVESRLRRSAQYERRMQVTGVPTIIVNGKYRSTAARAQGHDRLMRLTEYLVERERGGPAPARTAPAAVQAPDAAPPTGRTVAVVWPWVLALIVLGLVVGWMVRRR